MMVPVAGPEICSSSDSSGGMYPEEGADGVAMAVFTPGPTTLPSLSSSKSIAQILGEATERDESFVSPRS